MRAALIVLVAGAFAIPGSVARAQQSRPAGIADRDSGVRSPVWRECNPGADIVTSELRALSRHAGWGMFLGAIAGADYGLVTTTGSSRPLIVTWDTFVGATGGMTVGSVAYLVRRARGFRPPLRSQCARPGARSGGSPTARFVP